MRRKLWKKDNRKSNNGYTLVELIVSMALTAILATAVASIMFPVVSIFMDMQKLSRAQMVADTVTDALRKECASAYVNSVADVKVLNIPDAANHTSGDNVLVDSLNTAGIKTDAPGNALVFRINEGYAKALYWNTYISVEDYEEVRNNDSAEGAKMGLVTSRAVYRLISYAKKDSYTEKTMPAETRPGYLHCGYYSTRTVPVPVANEKKVDNFQLDKAYDYTNPFTVNAYNGFTVRIEFSKPAYQAVVAGSLLPEDLRPAYVVAMIYVYQGSFEEQTGTDKLVYSREAVLCFAEDNKRVTE